MKSRPAQARRLFCLVQPGLAPHDADGGHRRRRARRRRWISDWRLRNLDRRLGWRFRAIGLGIVSWGEAHAPFNAEPRQKAPKISRVARGGVLTPRPSPPTYRPLATDGGEC